jgi:SgrR family transcriptional regulator|nr:SgrR family transcriptional regulator [uncultured Tolumonas sp.]
MTSHRLEQQYLKLLHLYGQEPVFITLQALADHLFCTRRHMRNLLIQMEEVGWIKWDSNPGRGRQAKLHLLTNESNLLNNKANELFEAGHLAEALQLLEQETKLLAPLLRAKLGHTMQANRQVLRVPYYRPMPNLYPGTPLRRSEAHLVRQVFSGLTRINDEIGEVESDLAHHWQMIDQLHWRFFLRPAVLFHDGRELQINDVIESLTRCSKLPFFSHIQAISEGGARSVVIRLSVADRRLPWLLADTAAMILPADHANRPDFASRPIGTGPYQITANDALHLRLEAFDHYFGLRALLDEVDILMWPELAQQLELGEKHISMLDIRSGDRDLKTTVSSSIASTTDTSINDDISSVNFVANTTADLVKSKNEIAEKMVLEQGGYFLVCDSRSPLWKEIEQRRWLQEKLNPYTLQPHLLNSIRRFWSPASSVLPVWLHTINQGANTSPFPSNSGMDAEIKLAFYEQQPEYRMLAQGMAKVLAAEGIKLTIIELDYANWAYGNADVDLWLGSVNFPAPELWGIGAWLFGTPLLRRTISGGDLDVLSVWQNDWLREKLTSEQLVNKVVTSGWVQPLFHHWLHLQGPEHAKGIRLNNLGWFDFKSAWLI